MVILGIDPGTARCGFGAIEERGGVLRLLECGLIDTPAGTSAGARLAAIYSRLNELISTHKPDTVAVEELFYGNNAKTAIAVGQARGVILLAAANNGIATAEYTPPQIKLAVTGYGKADKEQVRSMVKTVLKLKELRGHDDVSDAVAVAVCHAFSCRMAARIGSAV
jgi:crossover junction endodeoxyribonuclease RuvC